MEEISCALSYIFDKTGYSQDMVRLRRGAWQRYADLENSMKHHAANKHLLMAGSKAEGTTSFYESDVDHMFILTDVICAEEVEGISDTAGLIVFQADAHSSPPGYTKLQLKRLTRGINSNLIWDSLYLGADGHKYISSTLYMSEQEQTVRHRNCRSSGQGGVTYNEIVGPSCPVSTGSLNADIVLGFLCYRPMCLKIWSRRRRQFKWPPADIIEDIVSGHGQVVPKGCDGSDTQFQDWRMCFIDSELKLVRSLNNTQIKLYILLKRVAKQVPNAVGQKVTSYMVKNVCFWIAEFLPAEIFKESNLVPLLIYSLRFLKCCICDRNFLPYYMIPERNLLAGRFQLQERQKLSIWLTDLILEGPRLTLRCPKIREAMTSIIFGTPEQLIAYSRTRDELEILKLLHTIFSIARQYGADTGDLCSRLRRKMADIVLPEWKFLRRGYHVDVNDIIMDRVEQYLS